MVLPISVYGSPVLRREAEEIEEDYPKLKELIDNMFETMAFADGVGLAAPQIGLGIRVFVMDLSFLAEEDPKFEGFRKVFINAEIVEKWGDEVSGEEGCLSLPGLRESVSRPDKIIINYLDENFEEHEEEYTGWAARVIQHEYDHIDGKLFIDYISPIRRRLIKSKLDAMAKGKAKAAYKTKVTK